MICPRGTRLGILELVPKSGQFALNHSQSTGPALCWAVARQRVPSSWSYHLLGRQAFIKGQVDRGAALAGSDAGQEKARPWAV